MSSTTQSGWKVTQTFGETRTGSTPLTDDQIISAIEYDDTGDYIAAGDKAGHITVYARNGPKAKGPEHGSPTRRARAPPQYSFHAEFKSHDPEFDYLKSLEIEEKINKIKWCKSSNNALFLLSTNDKTIKLWKVYDKKMQVVSENNLEMAKDTSSFTCPSALRMPTVRYSDTVTTACAKKIYANAHAYHINSIAVNSDCETYLSADDLRINLWSLGITNQSFNIVDIKPNNMEELTEVITAADFHPSHCNIMMYSSSRGSIKLGDLRESALCDHHAKLYEEPEDPASKSFFSEIIASISDVKFSPDGRYVIARDYLTLKVWDLNMESKPVQTINIHDQLKPKLCDLYENDCIFDKFECSVSNDGNNFVTGSYNSLFHIYDRYGKSDTCIEATKATKGRRHSMPASALKGAMPAVPGKTLDADTMDFNRKVLHTAWHPQHDEIAIARDSQLYFYAADRQD